MNRIQEQIPEWDGRALARYEDAAAEVERDRGQPPRPGDLFVLDEARAFPVEWALVEQDPEDEGRWVAVAADLDPLVGSADVEVSAESAAGPLSLRCGIEVRLAKELFDAEMRTGILDPEIVAEVRRKRAELAAGRPTGSALARETDYEAGYREWVEELTRARAALAGRTPRLSPAGGTWQDEEKPGQVIAFRRPARQGSIGNPSIVPLRGNLHSLAASILLVVSLGLGGGVVWQNREHRQRVAELEERLEAGARDEPLIDVPFAWLSPSPAVRGTAETLTVPSDARFLWLLLDVGDGPLYPGYRLEIFAGDTEAQVWSRDGLTRTGVREVSVALPSALLAAGEYRLHLYGVRDSPELVAEYAVEIE